MSERVDPPFEEQQREQQQREQQQREQQQREQQRDFVETFRHFLEEVVHQQRQTRPALTPLGELVQQHLGADVRTLPIVTETVAAHRYLDADIALALLAGSGNEPVGVSGGQSRYHDQFPELLSNQHVPYAPGAADYLAMHSGPDSQRQVVGYGIRLFSFEGSPVAVLQRKAAPHMGNATAALEVLAPDAATSSALLARIRALMLEHSALRGQVLAFEGGDFGPQAAGVAFLGRPGIPENAVVLPPGVLPAITAHAVGITERSEALREAGRHLKRGILLYGPPGTGKTLTIRHLLGRAENVTCVLLTGASIRFVSEATELARALQPAMVVLEDVDLVAMERGMHGGPQPLLFAVLDALDGLDGDADVAFVLTTNRVDTLEPALAQRPGRVDLAVELPLPAVEERRRLFSLYAEGLAFSASAVHDAADRAEGVTGSFAKELMRRAVLRAADAGHEPCDDDLAAALEELLSSAEALTRQLLGVRPTPPEAQGFGPPHGSGMQRASFGYLSE